ncbi:MAG: hypothetical protein COA58_11040 [Bacteroidetes bacterium]|nr:MAG: hypothetical protein COA58_11040 [Bacteroidota bacterium]
MKKYTVLALILFSIFGCENNKSENSNDDLSFGQSYQWDVEASDAGSAVTLGNENNSTEQKRDFLSSEVGVTANLKLIKTGRVTFESQDLQKIGSVIDEAIKATGAYASNENESKTPYRITRSISIRVPSNKFDELLARISQGVDRFDERNISVSDVTEEFYDLSARLKTKKEIETRYIQILSRAGKITEILEVEKQIGEIREEIERVEGRLKYLKNQVSMSTLSINYYETLTIESQNNYGFVYKLKNSFVRGWDVLLGFILGLITIWPLILIGFLAFFGIRKLRRKRAKSNK